MNKLRYYSGFYMPSSFAEVLKENKNLSELHAEKLKGAFWEIELAQRTDGKLCYVIVTDTALSAQRVIHMLFSAQYVIDGTNTMSDYPNVPVIFGNSLQPGSYEFSSCSVPYYFRLASVVSFDRALENAIAKYQISCDLYSRPYADIDGLDEAEKYSQYPLVQARWAFAIIAAYSVIEELGCEVKANRDNPSKLKNGHWNQSVLDDLKKRLSEQNIDPTTKFVWASSGAPSVIEFKHLTDRTILPNEYNVVNLYDAINQVSFLRSQVASHKLSARTEDLTEYDVFNSQQLARLLVLLHCSIRFDE